MPATEAPPERSRARIAPEVFSRYPDYRAFAVYADGLRNGPSDERSRRFLRDAEAEARRRFDSTSVTDHPHIAAWRSAYREFGAKPSRFWSSAEALARRAVKNGLPEINRIVDVYNMVSVRHAVPVGGEDRARISGEAVLMFAAGDEPFETVEEGRAITESPEPGEPIWRDALGVTCRRWNWRQCVRTALTAETVSAVFVLDALAPYGEAELVRACDDLIAGLQAVSSGCECELVSLGPPQERSDAGR